MRLLINTTAAIPYIKDHAAVLGYLMAPQKYSGPRLRGYISENIPVFSDNDRFIGVNDALFEKFIPKLAFVRVYWLLVPDVVADCAGTLNNFIYWKEKIKHIPLAYALQDGQTEDTVPWDNICAVFLGGSTAYKLSEDAMSLLYAAKKRGKYVHVGRVNTANRIYLFQHIADTIDGSSFSRFTNTLLPPILPILAQIRKQRIVDGTHCTLEPRGVIT